jgi:DNA-binding MarR family transcriptional regulator
MSTSSRPVKRRRRGAAPAASVHPLPARENGAFTLPATVSRSALLDNGLDERFRRMVYDLFTIADRMEAVRNYHAQRLGITAPQYSVLMAIAQFQGATGVGVGALAKTLHVSSAFIASETGKLARAGLVTKRQNPHDRRGVLLCLTEVARQKVTRLTPQIRSINDSFFAPLDRTAFTQFSTTAASLVRSSQIVMQRLQAGAKRPPLIEAAE